MDRRTALKLGLAALGGAACHAVLANPPRPPQRGGKAIDSSKQPPNRKGTTITYRGTEIRGVTTEEVRQETVYNKTGTEPIGVRTTLRVVGLVDHDHLQLWTA
jgi:hypothetical protein